MNAQTQSREVEGLRVFFKKQLPVFVLAFSEWPPGQLGFSVESTGWCPAAASVGALGPPALGAPGLAGALRRPLPGALRRLPSAPPDAAAGPATRHWIKNSSVPRPGRECPPSPPVPGRPARGPLARCSALGARRAALSAMQRRGALFGVLGGGGGRKMAAGDIGELLVPHMPTIRVPRSGDRVYKSECAFSYDSPVSAAPPAGGGAGARAARTRRGRLRRGGARRPGPPPGAAAARRGAPGEAGPELRRLRRAGEGWVEEFVPAGAARCGALASSWVRQGGG